MGAQESLKRRFRRVDCGTACTTVAGDRCRDRLSDFHPSFLPIGTGKLSNSLCADLREGDIGDWSHEGG